MTDPKSWYEYRFDITDQPPPKNENIDGIYNISSDNSFDKCLLFVLEQFMECYKSDENDLFRKIIVNSGDGSLDDQLTTFLNRIKSNVSLKEVKKEPTLLSELINVENNEGKFYIINVLKILSRAHLPNPLHRNLRFGFMKVWNFILVRFFKTEPKLYKLEKYIFRALKNKLKDIPNMSTFRTQVNPKDGCVASMHAALQRSITDMNEYSTDGQQLEYKRLSREITAKKSNVYAIETEVSEFSNIKNTRYAKASGISDTTLDSATEFEVRFGCYKLMKACGEAKPNKEFIDNFYNQCIMSGRQKKRDKAKLEDEHSLPFKVLFGVLKPEAFRVILTRMTHELNHKFIPEIYEKQEKDQPLEGEEISNASFTKRLVSQLKENKEYDQYTFYRFLFLFHAYWLANHFVLDSKDVVNRFKNLKNIKHLIDLAHTEFHRNAAGGIVRKFEPRNFDQFSLTTQVKQGGSRSPRKSYKKKKKIKVNMKINRTKKMIGGSYMVEDDENDDHLHFDIDGDLDNRYSPEYFTLSILSIFDALEMISDEDEVDVILKYDYHQDGSNLFENFKHDPILKLLNAIIDLLDKHVDPFFALYHKQVLGFYTSDPTNPNPYLQAREMLVNKIKANVVIKEHEVFTDDIKEKLRVKLLHLKTLIEESEMDDIYEELNELILIIDNPDFINVLNILASYFDNQKKHGKTKEEIQDSFLNEFFSDSQAFNVVNYKLFKQGLDSYMYPSAEKMGVTKQGMLDAVAASLPTDNPISAPLPSSDDDPISAPLPSSDEQLSSSSDDNHQRYPLQSINVNIKNKHDAKNFSSVFLASTSPPGSYIRRKSKTKTSRGDQLLKEQATNRRKRHRRNTLKNIRQAAVANTSKLNNDIKRATETAKRGVSKSNPRQIYTPDKMSKISEKIRREFVPALRNLKWKERLNEKRGIHLSGGRKTFKKKKHHKRRRGRGAKRHNQTKRSIKKKT